MTDQIKKSLAVRAKLERFLAEPRKMVNGDGYAEVTNQDWKDIHELFQSIIEAKFEEDFDGDVPIEFRLTNRHWHERNHFADLPYVHEAETEDDYFEIIEVAHMNLQIANDRLNRLHQNERLRRYKAKKAREAMANQNNV